MAKGSNKKRRKEKKRKAEVPVTNEPWLSQRWGLIIIGLISIALAIYMTWQLQPAIGLGEALLWGLGFGAAIWGVFALAYAFNRFVRGRK